jgi:predicted permease
MNGIKRLLHIQRDGAGIDRAVDEELEFHFDMTVRELMNSGLSPDEAKREANRRFGDVERARERLARIDRSRVGHERRAEWWSAVAQDLRYAIRGVRLKPLFAIGVVLTLGLGIGANAAMFAIVDRLLLRPPAFTSAPERTHRLYFARFVDGKDFVGGNAQYQRLLDLARDSKSMEIIAGYSQNRRAVGIGEAAREIEIGGMSANMWQMFDARPVIGRFFTPDEDRDGNVSHVVVLAYGYWQSQYAGARDVVGKRISIGPSEYTIIGVAPRGFAGVEMVTPSMFIPLTASAADGFGSAWARFHASYNITWIKIFARRKPGVTVEAATADLTNAYRGSWTAQIAIQPRTPKLEVTKPRVIVGSILEQRGPTSSADTRVATWLLGVTSIVLLIACANVSNLLLARAFNRRREIAVRIALGVSRTRLVGQLLIESLLLSLLGAAAGLAFAQFGGQILRSTLMPQVEWGNTLADGRVLLFAAATAISAGLLSGLAPIFHAARSDVAASLKSGTREGHGQRSRARTVLLVTQAALSVILLIGAGLFVRSLQNIQTLHLGYDVDRILWIEPHMRGVKIDSAQAVALRNSLIERALRDARIENASLVMTVPFSSTYSGEAYAVGADSTRFLKDVIQQDGSPSYFATTGTRILRGRGITTEDRNGGALVAIVSETMARSAWPQQDALGRCLRLEADTMPCRTVVGIAEDIQQGSFSGPPDPMVYVPIAQDGENRSTIFFRTRGDAALHTESIRRELQQLMPGASYLVAQPLSDVLAPATRSWRLGATMFAVFGGLALVLAAIGLYSVVAYSVTQRTHEMGVRVALGAQVRDVVRLVVGDGVRVVIVGVAIGIGLALSAGHWLAPLLFKVSARDPIVFALVAAVLIGVALTASALPAFRASRVDPAKALRAD